MISSSKISFLTKSLGYPGLNPITKEELEYIMSVFPKGWIGLIMIVQPQLLTNMLNSTRLLFRWYFSVCQR